MTHPRSTLVAAAVVLLLAVPGAGPIRAAEAPASPAATALTAASATPLTARSAKALTLPATTVCREPDSTAPFAPSAAALAAPSAAALAAPAATDLGEPSAATPTAPAAPAPTAAVPLGAAAVSTHETGAPEAATDPPPGANLAARDPEAPTVPAASDSPPRHADPTVEASTAPLPGETAPPRASSPNSHPTIPDAESLARAYRRTGAAPTVERPTDSLFPFGHVRPALRCAPLRACAVELEAGELVLATSLGDSERWLLQAASSGPGARTPILVVKPTACDLSTNLVVATDRRIYEISLDSPPCHNADAGETSYNPHLQYTGVARFYYPDDLVRRWSGQEELAREQAERQAAGRTPLAAGARLAHLNFDYSWDRARRWPWVPAQVFDDGEHTYIALPPGAHLAEMPLLFALGSHGELALLNYHLDGQTLVADRVLERAALVVGGAKKRDEQRLELVNRAFGAPGAASARAARP
jgi:P-type conjugative transfer protein TrbG